MYTARPALQLRQYQQDAVEQFFADPPAEPNGDGNNKQQTRRLPNSGLMVMPCGAGKTITTIGILARAGVRALWITPVNSAAHQCVDAIHRYTTARAAVLSPKLSIRTHITVATYSALAPRQHVATTAYTARTALRMTNPQIVVFDEVHRMPADTFQRIVDLYPSPCRIGLTATLVRKDGRIGVAVDAIGRPIVRQPWAPLVSDGWLPHLELVDVCIVNVDPFNPGAVVAATTSVSVTIARWLQLRGRHVVLYADELATVARLRDAYGWPCIEGETPDAERSEIISQFNQSAERVAQGASSMGMCIVCSRVADAAIDLFADVGIEVTRRGGLEQKVQRAGRCMRSRFVSDTGARSALYITVVVANTPDAAKAHIQSTLLFDEGYVPRNVVLDGSQLCPAELFNW